MDVEQAVAKAERFAERVAEEFKPRRIVLFGSYSDGTYREWSDIDVAVVFDESTEPDDWLKASVRIHAICREVKGSEIEPHIMDVTDGDASTFVNSVIKRGKVLYPKA